MIFQNITRRDALRLGSAGAAVTLGAAAGLWPAAARANALAMPAGPIVLTVRGQISNANEGDTAIFDQAMLDALDQHETITATPWHDGRPVFSGPTMAAILDATGAAGTTLKITALNDYSAELPLSDAYELPLILASRIDGALIPVRNKGPLFVIYPFDEYPETFNEIYFGRSVWQVAAIEVLA